MNYIFYIVVICSFFGLIVLPLWFRYCLKLDFFSKQILRNTVLKKTPFFSSYIIRESVKISLKHHLPQALEYLFKSKPAKASPMIGKYNPLLGLLLKGLEKPASAVRQLYSLIKKNPKEIELYAWLAILLEKTEDKTKVQASWDNLRIKKLPDYLKAYYLSYQAQIALKNGDLEFASRYFYRAAALFNKSKAFYEEANLYLLLGTVYRISFLEDIAETLFRSALKAFDLLDFKEGIAKTYANLGLLMTGQERFTEAESYFEKALNLYISLGLKTECAEIQNQQALLALLQQDYLSSQRLLRQAKKEHLSLDNTQGVAFSLELMANCYWKLRDFKKTIQNAKKAAHLYFQCQNISGLLDSMYLQAQACFSSDDDLTAESLLREIISIGKKDCGCFYLANAYTLLGIVFMKRRDFQRAKGLFQQSLDLEQRGVRLNALAADYANIGLAESSRGSTDEALKNLKTALELAKQAEAQDLCNQIQKQLDILSKRAE